MQTLHLWNKILPKNYVAFVQKILFLNDPRIYYKKINANEKKVLNAIKVEQTCTLEKYQIRNTRSLSL